MQRWRLPDLRQVKTLHPGFSTPMNENATGIPYTEVLAAFRAYVADYKKRFNEIYCGGSRIQGLAP